jgi:hypothetical protein
MSTRRTVAPSALGAGAAATLLVVDLLAAGPARPLALLAVATAYAAGRRRGPTRRTPDARAPRHVSGRATRVLARRRCERTPVAVHPAGAVPAGAGPDATLVELDIARALVELLGLRDCRYEPGDRPSGLPVLRSGGEVELCGLRWSPVPIGLPERGFEVELAAGGVVGGRFVCIPRRREPIPRDRLDAAIALADRAASARLTEHIR